MHSSFQFSKIGCLVYNIIRFVENRGRWMGGGQGGGRGGFNINYYVIHMIELNLSLNALLLLKSTF